MEITITIKESESVKPSVTVKEEGNNPKSSSKKPSENQDSKKEKPEKSNIRTEKELVKRRKVLLELREQIKKDIEASENPAKLRRELEELEQTLVEYKWFFKEIE